MTSWCN